MTTPLIAAVLATAFERLAAELSQAKEPVTLDGAALALVALGMRAAADANKPRPPAIVAPVAVTPPAAPKKKGRPPKVAPRAPEQQPLVKEERHTGLPPAPARKAPSWDCRSMGHVADGAGDKCRYCGSSDLSDTAEARSNELGVAP